LNAHFGLSGGSGLSLGLSAGDARGVAPGFTMTSPALLAVGLIMAIAAATDQLSERRSQDPPARQDPSAQGPRLPPPPADAAPLPPVEDPPTTYPVHRDDLGRRGGTASPLEGMWRLRRFVRTGQPPLSEPDARGYLAFGREHLFVHLQLVSPAGGAFLQSGVYRWRTENGSLVTSTLSGHRSDGRDIAAEPVGAGDSRGFLLVGAVLRVGRSADEYLEFVRIE
jgi:hypothetical protein